MNTPSQPAEVTPHPLDPNITAPLNSDVRQTLTVFECTDFASCERELADFAATHKPSNPFLSITWISTWWKHNAQGKRLCILLFRENDRLIAYAPLYHQTHLARTVHEYRFLGHGTSNYLSIPCISGYEHAVTRTFLSHFRTQHPSAILNLIDINSASPLSTALDLCLPRHPSRARRFNLYPCPYADLDNDWKSLLSRSISKSKYRSDFKRKLNIWMRKLSRLGPVEFHIISNTESFEALFRQLRDIHNARFSTTTNTSLKGRRQSFIYEVMQCMLNRGIHVSILTLDAQPISFIIGLQMGTTFVHYIPAFHPLFSRFSPGHIHLTNLINHLSQDGYRVFDSSKGSSNYKRKWSINNTWNYQYIFTADSTLLSNLYCIYLTTLTTIVLFGRTRGFNKQFKHSLATLSNFMRTCFRFGKRTRYDIRLVTDKYKCAGHFERMSYSRIKNLPHEVKAWLVAYAYESRSEEIDICFAGSKSLLLYDASKDASKGVDVKTVYTRQ